MGELRDDVVGEGVQRVIKHVGELEEAAPGQEDVGVHKVLPEERAERDVRRGKDHGQRDARPRGPPRDDREERDRVGDADVEAEGEGGKGAREDGGLVLGVHAIRVVDLALHHLVFGRGLVGARRARLGQQLPGSFPEKGGEGPLRPRGLGGPVDEDLG